MNRRPLISLSVLAFVTLATALLFVLRSDHSQDAKARAQLDQVLGADPDPPLPFSAQPVPAPEADPFGALAENPFGFSFSVPSLPGTGVNVEETAQAYILTIPMKERADEKNVRLKVEPHHIDVSGQITEKSDHGSFSSSFMQSFGTRDELLPDQVSRTYRNNKLVITVPKKAGASAHTPAPGKPAPSKSAGEKSLPPDVIRELNQSNQEVI